MREGLEIKIFIAHDIRITPACAGRTEYFFNGFVALSDHPRVCGKDCILNQNIKVVEGSPPRVREGQRLSSLRRRWIRITPACAGRTLAFCLVFPTAQDHPRVRGKDICQIFSFFRCIGSPPRAREGPNAEDTSGGADRITPACAGRTIWAALKFAVLQDHPRVRGKDRGMRRRRMSKIGSPPRAREGPPWLDDETMKVRITPACAGRTLKDPVFCNVLF